MNLREFGFCEVLAFSTNVAYTKMFFRTTIDRLWEKVLADPTDPILMEMKEFFASVIDISDSLRGRRFSILHCIVLGLSTIDLEQQLIFSTAEIESRCSMGRTPLLWAASIGNKAAIEVLIRFGADLKVVDKGDLSVLHRTVSVASEAPAERIGKSNEILAILLNEAVSIGLVDCPDSEAIHTPGHGINNDNSTIQVKRFIDFQDMDGATALTRAAYHGSLIQARLLLSHGASPQVTSKTAISQPILATFYRNSRSVLRLLLRNPMTQLDVSNVQGLRILHMAAGYGDLQTLTMLIDHGLCCINPEAPNNEGQTPLQFFESWRPVYLDEDEETQMKSRDAFIQLLHGIKSHVEPHDCWKSRIERKANVEIDNESLDEEFFDFDTPAD